MPIKKVDYSKTVIYKIACKDLNVLNTYVGHTCNFNVRKSIHKYHCNNPLLRYYNFKIYKIIRENGGWDNWCMVELEKYPCLDGKEATSRERYWYEKLNANMNSNTPGSGGGKEWRLLHSDYHKNYYEDNKKKFKKYYEKNKNKKLYDLVVLELHYYFKGY